MSGSSGRTKSPVRTMSAVPVRSSFASGRSAAERTSGILLPDAHICFLYRQTLVGRCVCVASGQNVPSECADRTPVRWHRLFYQSCGQRPRSVRTPSAALSAALSGKNGKLIEMQQNRLSPQAVDSINTVRTGAVSLPDLPRLDQRQGTLYSGTWNYTTC